VPSEATATSSNAIMTSSAWSVAAAWLVGLTLRTSTPVVFWAPKQVVYFVYNSGKHVAQFAHRHTGQTCVIHVGQTSSPLRHVLNGAKTTTSPKMRVTTKQLRVTTTSLEMQVMVAAT
jgi:hypothetical protein